MQQERHIIVEARNGSLKTNVINWAYDSLHYVLMGFLEARRAGRLARLLYVPLRTTRLTTPLQMEALPLPAPTMKVVADPLSAHGNSMRTDSSSDRFGIRDTAGCTCLVGYSTNAL